MGSTHRRRAGARAEKFRRLPGTAIEVSDLFYNTPALPQVPEIRGDGGFPCGDQIRLHALAYPQVRFTYKRDDQLVFDLPATADLRVRISALTDAATAAALIPIETTIGPGISVTGFLLPLSEARRTRKGQYVFMNTRPVEDQLINRAIRDGYGGFPTGLHPALFLYMEVEPALVDVNVHPAKKEVRFRRSADVVNTIVEAIANTLQKHARQEIHASAAVPETDGGPRNRLPPRRMGKHPPGRTIPRPSLRQNPARPPLLPPNSLPFLPPPPAGNHGRLFLFPPAPHSPEAGSRHPGETGFPASGGGRRRKGRLRKGRSGEGRHRRVHLYGNPPPAIRPV